MAIYIPALLLIVAGSACNTPAPVVVPVDSTVNTAVEAYGVNTSFKTEKLTGVYTGIFDGTPISISINYVNRKNVSGYNVHKGLKRNMHGSIEPFGPQFSLKLDEPGNNQYDGHFELFIDTASFAGKGTWAPKNNASLKKKEFIFKKSNLEQFNEIANAWTDSLSRTLWLKPDGSAIFSYYAGKGTSSEQMENFGGNWQQKKDSIIVYWQPNTLFPARRSAFFIVMEKNESDSIAYLSRLRGEHSDWFNEAP